MLATPQIELKYNGNNCTDDFLKYLDEIVYTDYEDEHSDELEMILNDNHHKFKNEWYPSKGDVINCQIHFENNILDCGDFTIDEPEFSGNSNGHSVTIKALAAGIKNSTRTKRTVRYGNKLLSGIVGEVAKRHNYNLIGEGMNITVGGAVQAKETDLEFLQRLAKIYGFIFKITGKTLVFTSLDSLFNSDSLFSFSMKDLKSYSFRDTTNKKYKYCIVSYFDPTSKKLCQYKATSSEETPADDTLKLNLKCDSLATARTIANNSLKINKVTSANIVLKEPNPLIVAGTNISLSDFGNVSGKYHVKKTTHRINSDLNYVVTVDDAIRMVG